MLYNNLSGYFREKYNKRLSKICIDAGFSCPNRDGKVGFGGCIFCGERGAGEHIDNTASITEQVSRALSNGRDTDEYVAYFQNFTNTYAPVDVLRQRYDASLIDPRIRVLAVGTRPDCIDREVASLLSEYAREREVWVELGLQTANDNTAKLINRGYNRECFSEAMRILSEYGLKACVHLIVGLPGEGMEDIKESVRYLSSFDIFGLKIHSLYVMEGTRLSELYREKRYTPPTLSEYVKAVAYIISHTPRSVVIHRITGDCPEGMLVAPEWSRNKHSVIEAINEELLALGASQGSSL